MVDDCLPRFSRETDYFLGITPEQAEKGTIGILPALNSDNYSIFPGRRHVFDEFDHAWVRFGLTQTGRLSREYVIGAYGHTSQGGGWLSFLPLRVLFAPNAQDTTKLDMSVGIRTPVQNSATFMKARSKFWEVVRQCR